MAWRWVYDTPTTGSKQYITSSTATIHHRVMIQTFNILSLTHLSVFLQLEQSWANLHWSACLCAILASSSSHTCRQIIRWFTPVPGKQYLWVSGLDGVYQKKFVTGEKWLSSQNSSSNSKLLRNCRNKLWTIVKTIGTTTYYSVD